MGFIRPQRVWFFSRFGHKYGVIFASSLDIGMFLCLIFITIGKKKQQKPFTYYGRPETGFSI